MEYHEFEFPDGWYSVSDIQDNFKHIIEKHGRVTYNPELRIYVNKIEIGLHLNSKQGIIWNF